MKILKNFILFWIPTVIVLCISFFSLETTDDFQKNMIPIVTILQRNLVVLLLIWLSGFINKDIPRCIFGFNAIFF